MIRLRCFKWAHTREPGNRNGAGLFSCQCFPASVGKFLTYFVTHLSIQLIEHSHHSLTWTMAKLETAERNISSYQAIVLCQKTRSSKAERKQLSSLQKTKQNSQTVHQMSPPQSLNSANRASSWAFIPFPSSSFSPPLYSSLSLFSTQSQCWLSPCVITLLFIRSNAGIGLRALGIVLTISIN